MESTDLQLQRQLQQQFNGFFSLETKTAYKVPRTQDWNSSNIDQINDSSYNTYMTESISRSKEPWPSPISSTIVQDNFIHQSANELPLANNKEEMPDFFPKHNEMLYRPYNTKAMPDFFPEHNEMVYRPYNINDQQPQCSYDLGENLWPNNFSLGHDITELQLSAGEGCPNPQNPTSLASAATSSRFFSHIFPSSIISTSDLSASSVSGPLDLLTCTYHDGNSSQSSHNINHGTLSESTFLGQDDMPEQRDHSPSNSSNKVMQSLVNGVTSTKRPGSFPESKETHEDSKKNRSRSSFPPLKVKKGKLGDRIQTLQKLVAPFGKTDTATVLTEAIGYIQFLHDQVHTLSMPYMNSSYRDRSRGMQPGSIKEERDEESKRDLRRRWLCLVPLSYASYCDSYNDGIGTSDP